MRVGIDGRALQLGFKQHAGRGIGHYAAGLVNALARLDDVQVVLYLDARLPAPEEPLPPGIERARYPRAWVPLPLPKHSSTQLLVPFALRGGAVDVFHFLAHGDAPLALSRHTVVTVHDVILEVVPELYRNSGTPLFRLARAVERGTITRARVIVTDSEASREDIVRLMKVDRDRVHVAPLGIDERFHPPAPDEVADLRARHGLKRRFVLYLGGIDARKNAIGLLDAYARLRAGRAEPPDLVMAGAIAGEPEFPAFMGRAAQLGLADSLHVLGYVSDADLPALLGAAEVFAFPSLYEGFGLPPLEAMACGTPVVATRAGSLPEVLGDAAVLVPPGDVAAFGTALGRVLDDAALRARLREQGPQRARGFTWDATARATRAAYRAAYAGARGSRGMA